MNIVRMEPGRDPLGLEEHPVTVQHCVKAKERNTEKESDLIKKNGKKVHTKCLDLIRLVFSNVFSSCWCFLR